MKRFRQFRKYLAGVSLAGALATSSVAGVGLVSTMAISAPTAKPAYAIPINGDPNIPWQYSLRRSICVYFGVDCPDSGVKVPTTQ